jgi:hypothetical protein
MAKKTHYMTTGLHQKISVSVLFTAIFMLIIQESIFAQLQRERADTGPVYVDIFPAPANTGLSTVYITPKRNLNSTILHTFGLIKGGIEHFYGLDDGANTRLGLDYGISDRFSIGIGRMTFLKVVDVNSKIGLMKQTADGNNPLSITLKVSSAVTTLPGIQFSDRLNYFTGIMFARKFHGISLQVSPMLTYYQRLSEENHNRLFGIGFIAAYELNDRFSLSGELLPVLSNRYTDTHTSMALSLNIDTGGHIFQIFFTSSQWHNEPYIMANNRDRFLDGDIRFGFNIHRTFGL